MKKKKKKLYDGRTSIAKKFVERILKQREARRVAEEVELEEKVKQPRQLINPSKEAMVVKNNKVIVVDKKDLKQYTSKGWSLAEDIELDEMRGIYVVRNDNGRMIAKNKNRNAIDKERKKYETQTGNKTTMNIEKEPVPDLKEEVELDEAKFQVNYSKGGKLFSKTVNAKNEDDAEDKAIKQFKIEDDDIRSVVKEASARADAMRAMGRGRKVDPADIDEPKALSLIHI